MSEPRKVKMVCSTCGSNEVGREISQWWSIAEQAWMPGDVQSHYCCNCDSDKDFDEADLDVRDLAAMHIAAAKASGELS